LFFQAPEGELSAPNNKPTGEVQRGAFRAPVLRDEIDAPLRGPYLVKQ